MAKYHISGDGTPGICRAKDGNCPLGGAAQHFDNIEDANAAAQKMMENSMGVGFSKSENDNDGDVKTKKKNLNEIKELVKLLEKNGFYGNEVEDVMEYGGVELVKKSYGDSDEGLTSAEFGADYNKLIKLASKNGVKIPEYVYYD